MLLVFGTISHDAHKKRRAAISPFFSKASVTDSESLIQSKADDLIASLDQQFCKHGYSEMRKNFLAFTTDVLCEHTFNESMDLLLDDRKATEWQSTIKAIAVLTPLIKQFVWIIPIALRIPARLLMYIVPVLGRIVALRKVSSSHIKGNLLTIQDMRRQARNVIRDHKTGIEKGQYIQERNIFSSILHNSSLPNIEKREDRLAQEGFVAIAAGGETTARVLTTALFFILEKRSNILPRLMKELSSIEIDSDKYPTWKQLEQLPWLVLLIVEEGALLTDAECNCARIVAINRTSNFETSSC